MFRSIDNKNRNNREEEMNVAMQQSHVLSIVRGNEKKMRKT